LVQPGFEPEIHPARQRDLQRCVQKLGLPPGIPLHWGRLDQALTHKSVDAHYNYEQLELLGDAVLRLAATEFLQRYYPQESVGKLSALRSAMISDRALGQMADRLGLAPYLITAEGGQPTPGMLADTLEAVVAVVYRETQTLQLVRSWLDPHFQQMAMAIDQDPAHQNYKVALQELTQAYNRTLPQYRTTEQHPKDNHPQRYRSEVWFQNRCWGQGQGPTKKQAEQAAAAIALAPLTQQLTQPDPA
jgi:ribonuclease-3